MYRIRRALSIFVLIVIVSVTLFSNYVPVAATTDQINIELDGNKDMGTTAKGSNVDNEPNYDIAEKSNDTETNTLSLISEKQEYKTDRFIIKYKNDTVKSTVRSKLNDKVKDTKSIKNSRFDIVFTKDKMSNDEFIKEVKDKNADSNIEYIQPDYEMTVESINSMQENNTYSNDTLYPDQWGIYNKETESPQYSDEKFKKFVEEDRSMMGFPSSPIDVNVQDAWEKASGEEVIVAVIDTAMDITHEDLAENIWVNKKEIPNNGIDDDKNGFVDDINGWNFYDKNNVVHDKNSSAEEGHATHIAGVIAGIRNNNKGIVGVAPNSKIMPIKVFGNGVAYTSDIIDAIVYAAEMGAKVVNCSWGITGENIALRETMERSGVLFVSAAGNSNKNIDEYPVSPASFNIPNLITVASINRKGQLSGFSNYGPNSVHVAAPGEEILSTLPQNKYGISSGTSIATGFVAGEAALILSQDKALTPLQVKDRVINSSDVLTSLSGKIVKGNINCANAINNITSNKVIEVPYSENITSYVEQDGYNLFAADSWSAKATMPTARRNFGMAEVDGKVYAIGGFNGGYLKNVEAYDPIANSWSIITAMPTAREGLVVVSSYDKIYAIGGYNGGYLNTVEEYNPVTNTWTAKTSMPTARTDAGAAVVNGKIYVVGGYNGTYLNKVEVYDPLTNTWTTVASMPTARAELGVAAVNGKVYAIGGYFNGYLNIVQEYDPYTNIWLSKRSMPTARKEIALSTTNNKIVVIGGFNDNYLNIVEEFNPALDTWISKTNTSIAKTNASASVYNENIYVMGGYNGSYLNSVEEYRSTSDAWVKKSNMLSNKAFFGTAAVDGKIYIAGGTKVGNSAFEYEGLDEFEVYDTRSNTWEAKAIKPRKSFGLGAAVVNGKFYAVGGYDWDTDGSLNTMEEYNPTTNTWITKANMAYGRYAPGVAELNGKIYALGGMNVILNSYKTCEAYDPTTDSWTGIADMSIARYGLTVAAVNGKIYAIGGYSDYASHKVLNIVEEYNPATNTWTRKADMPTSRTYAGATVINGKIYVIGGSNGNYLTTVEVYDPITDKWTSKPGMSVGRMRLGVTSVDGKIYSIGGYNSNYLNIVEEYVAEYDKYVIQNHFGENGANPATGNFSRTYNDMSMTSPGFQINISRTYNSQDDKVGSFGRGWIFGFEGSAKDDPANSSIKVVKLPNGSVQTFSKNTDGTYTAKDSRSLLVKQADNTHILTTKDQYKYTFNTNGFLTVMSDRNGNRISIDVDGSGKVTRITDQPGRYFSIDYAGTSYIRYINDIAGGRRVEYQYENNRLARVIDPMGITTSYFYDTEGYLNQVKDHKQNIIETVNYNHAAGENQHKISTTIDKNGNVFTYAYDNANKGTSITDSNGRQIIYHYDNCMYVSTVTDPGNRESSTEYFMDLNGANKYGEERIVTDRNGNRTE